MFLQRDKINLKVMATNRKKLNFSKKVLAFFMKFYSFPLLKNPYQKNIQKNLSNLRGLVYNATLVGTQRLN
jgi:hypothetical protein